MSLKIQGLWFMVLSLKFGPMAIGIGIWYLVFNN